MPRHYCECGQWFNSHQDADKCQASGHASNKLVTALKQIQRLSKGEDFGKRLGAGSCFVDLSTINGIATGALEQFEEQHHGKDKAA